MYLSQITLVLGVLIHGLYCQRNIALLKEDYQLAIAAIYRSQLSKIDIFLDLELIEECFDPKASHSKDLHVSRYAKLSVSDAVQSFIGLLQCFKLIEKDKTALAAFDFFANSKIEINEELSQYIWSNPISLQFAVDYLDRFKFVSRKKVANSNLLDDLILAVKKSINDYSSYRIDFKQTDDFEADFIDYFKGGTKYDSIHAIISTYSLPTASIAAAMKIPYGVYLDKFVDYVEDPLIHYFDGRIKAMARAIGDLAIKLKMEDLNLLRNENDENEMELLKMAKGRFRFKSVSSYTETNTQTGSRLNIYFSNDDRNLNRLIQSTAGTIFLNSQFTWIFQTTYNLLDYVQQFTEVGSPIFSFVLPDVSANMLSTDETAYRISKLFDTFSLFDLKTKNFDGKNLSKKNLRYPVNLVNNSNDIRQVGIVNYRNFKNKVVGTWTDGSISIGYSTPNLAKSIIRVLIIKTIPWYWTGETGEAWGISKSVMDYVNIQKDGQIEFDFFVYDPPPNGLLNEFIIKKINANEIDISLYPVERSVGVSFTNPILQNNRVVLSVAHKDSFKLSFLLSPYQTKLWVLICLSIPVWIVFLVLNSAIWSEEKTLDEKDEVIVVEFDQLYKEQSNRRFKIFRWIDKYFFHVTQVMLFSRFKAIPKSFSSSVMHMILYFYSLMVMLTFAAVFSAYFHYSVLQSEISSISDLTNSKNYKWFYLKDSYAYSKSVGKTDYKEAVKRFGSSHSVATIEEAFSLLSSSRDTFFISDRVTANFYSRILCDLKIIDDMSEVYVQAIALQTPETFDASKQFVDYLNSLFYERDLLGNYFTLYFDRGICGNKESLLTNAERLTYDKMGALFLFLYIGILASLLAVLSDFIVKKVKDYLINKKYKRLKFGQIYECKIVNIRDDGIYIYLSDDYPPFFVQNSQLHDDPIKNLDATELGLAIDQKISLRYFGRDKTDKNIKWVYAEESVYK